MVVGFLVRALRARTEFLVVISFHAYWHSGKFASRSFEHLPGGSRTAGNGGARAAGAGERQQQIVRARGPVSYTHLTLPTIYSV